MLIKTPPVSILGAGSFGTALAIHLAMQQFPVKLWARDVKQVEHMRVARRNERYLPTFAFPALLTPTNDLADCLTPDAEIIIAVPSHAFTALLTQIKPPRARIAWLTKGLDPNTHDLLSTWITAHWGKQTAMAAISGPSFAAELAEGLPTALVIAGNDPAHTHTLQKLLHQHHLRTYVSHDLIGVQLCGAIKNVLAIACGVSDGMCFGANARAALITRGLAEMRRLGTAMGAQAETFTGLAGIGDLVLTCTDNQSRNRRFGLLIGKGHSQIDAETQIGQVVEGKTNAAQITALATRHHVDMPICQTVYDLLSKTLTPKEALMRLMNRPPQLE